MSREQMPVTPGLITWARERAGFTREAAAVTFKMIAEWEAGEAFPTYPQLEKLAPVSESDIQTWLSLYEVRQFVAGHESALLNIANDERYCIKPGQVHMLRFAEAAHALLNK